MKHLGTIIALVTFILFVWFCHYSYEHKRDIEHGYDHSEFDVLKPHKVVRAQALQSLYYLSNDDITAPVDLFNEHGRVK